MFAAMAAGAFIWNASPAAMAMDEIMPLSELQEGMTGELYTVVDGSGDIRSFGVTILGVMQNGKAMPYIVARSEGAFADTDGGLMQGMSGSPVYVDGRLIGAGSATLKEMDPHTFLITPIEEMLPIWDLPDTKNQSRAQAIDLKKRAEEKKKAEEKKNGEKKDDGLIITLGQTGGAKPDKKAADEKKEPQDAAKSRAEEKPESAAKTTEKDNASSKDAKDSKSAAEEKKADAEKSDTKKADEAKSDAANNDAADDTKKKDDAKNDAAKEQPADNKEKATPKTEQKALVYAGGFGERGMKFLQKLLDPMGLKASPFGAMSSASYTTDYAAELYPGSPVGAALAYGDFAFAATGTVTAVEEDGRVLAFGHPFLHRGNVNYFMTDASVFAMVNGMTDGMKLATTGSIIGRISQDRTAGIAGTVGVFPSVVPIRLSVEDKSLGRTASYAATMAYDEAFVPILTQTIAYAALGRTVDNMSESTVKVHFSIRTDAAENGVFDRTNLFYAAADTGQIAFAELAQTLAVIASDTMGEADLYDIKVDVASEAERRTASLVSATPEKQKVKPGETVKFKVTLQPYRAQQITLDVPFTVPKRRRDGMMHLDVHGGGLVSLEKLLQAAQAEAGVVTPDGPEGAKTVKDKLHDLGETDANNEIVIEPGAGPTLSEKEQKKEIEAAIRRQEEEQASGRKATPSAPPKAKLATDYVIDNVIHTAIEVSQKED
ncbi:MAG: SpoIVB peptidase S55 domain protein [Schwartzia sp.]|nr:SpoIVB peptidase S55 domain protein [Schwartzia sp. (in: firmicutes)]